MVMQRLARLVKGKNGQGMTEYIIIVALIAIAAPLLPLRQSVYIPCSANRSVKSLAQSAASWEEKPTRVRKQ